MQRFAAVLLLIATACGDDGGNEPRRDAAIDSRIVDAAPDAQAFVRTVACGSEVATVTTVGDTFSPDTVTIMQNEIVRFTMPSDHNVVPDLTGSDPGLFVFFGETKCLQFTTTGTFNFRCGPHNFAGSITVN